MSESIDELGDNRSVSTLRLSLVAIAALTIAGCNSRLPVIDATAPTVPTSVIGTPTMPASTLVSMTVDPPAVFAGDSASGRIVLSFPAPASGFAVVLSTSDSSVGVPASVLVPPGADAAQFSVSTRSVNLDTNVTVSASASERTLQSGLLLWTKTPPFVATWTVPVNSQRTVAQRVTRSGQWRANCYGSGVYIGANDAAAFYALDFVAPEGAPLRAGTYENAQTLFTNPRNPSRPLLELTTTSGFSSCADPTVSRFTVSQVDVVGDRLGTVRRFAATFEQTCGQTSIRGELSVVGVSPTNTSGSQCIVP